MPSNKVIEKHIDETLDLFVDFANRQTIQDGAALTGTPTVEERDTADLTITGKSTSGTKVQARIAGGSLASGENEKIYWIDFGADLDSGEHVEDSVRLRVYDKRPLS